MFRLVWDESYQSVLAVGFPGIQVPESSPTVISCTNLGGHFGCEGGGCKYNYVKI